MYKRALLFSIEIEITMSDHQKISLPKIGMKEKQAEALISQKQARTNHTQQKIYDRRNVLLGAFFADQAARNPKLMAYVESHIFTFHTRKRDQDFLRAWLDKIKEKASC